MTMLKCNRNLLGTLRFDLDADSYRLANARDGFGRWSKHQIEVTPVNWVCVYRPPRSSGFTRRRQQFHMERDRLRYAVHCEVAENVAALRASLFHAPALECDMREFFDVKKFRAPQMIVAFLDPR